jgi:hypothetical protein
MNRFLVVSSSELEINVFLEFSREKKLEFHSLLFLDHKLKIAGLEKQVKILSLQDFAQMNWIVSENSISPVANSDIEFKVIWAIEIFLEMVKRQDSHKNLSYEQRREMFSIQISFWTEYLKQNQINRIFFSTCPHEIFDFTLYLVAKALDIDVAILQDNHVLGRKIAVDNIFAPWNSTVNTRMLENQTVSIEGIRNTLTRAKNLINPAWVLSARNKKKFSFKDLKEMMFSLAAGFNLAFRLPVVLITFWSSQLSIKSNKRVMNYLAKYIDRMKKYISMMAYLYELKYLKIIRNDYLINELPKTEFCTLFLNFNPEMMLNPLGFPFNRDMNVISKVRSLVPQEQALLVREHPSQFSPGYGYLGRNLNFYSSVDSFPNTFIISSEYPLSELLDSSAMVFTLNGTVGWQAAARGIKVGILGNAWFEDMPNSTRIHQHTTSRDVMNWLNSAPIATSDSLEKFLVTVYENSFSYIPSEDLAAITGHSWDYEINKRMFCKFLELHL